MQFLDITGVKQMKRYNDQTYIQAKSATESVGGELGVYTKAEIDNIISGIESGGADLTNYYTKSQVDTLISNIPSGSADLSNYYTKSQIDNKGYITSVPSEYITETELASYNFLTTHQDLSNYATQSWVNSQIANAEIGGGGGSTIDFTNYVQFTDTFNATKNGVVPKPTNAQYSNSDYYLAANGTWVDIEDKINYYSSSFSGDYNDLSNTPDLSGFLTSSDLSGYATESYVDNAIPDTSNFLTSSDLSGYATESYVDNAIPDVSGFLTSSDLSGYAETANLATVAFTGDYNDLSNTPDIVSYLSSYVDESDLTTALNDYMQIGENISNLTNDAGYITSSDLSGYATETYVDNAVANIDLSNYATNTYLASEISRVEDWFTDYTTTEDLTSFVEGVLSDHGLI